MATRTRGRRLPQRVYWVRRALVLVVAAALVLGIARLVGGLGSDPQPAASQDRASTVASRPSSSGRATGPAVGPVAPPTTGRKAKAKVTAAALAPQGVCSDDEISVLPQVTKAAAGGTIAITLQLTGTQPACTYSVSSKSLAVKVTSGTDRIWSSQDCPKAVPDQSVVVRSGTPTPVTVSWSGRRSDDDCSTHTNWALPGFYHVYAAVIGSSPTDVQFEVTLPDRPVVTRTARPRPASTSPSPTTSSSPSTQGKQSKCGGDNAAGSC